MGLIPGPVFGLNFWKVLPMNRPVRKARAIAIAKAREDQNTMIVRTAALGLVASFLGYGLMALGFFG
jgi:hypothetical protein